MKKNFSSRNRSENRGRVSGRTRAEKSRGIEERRLEIRRGDQYACTGNAFGRWSSCPHASGTPRRKEKKKKKKSIVIIADKFDIVLIYTPTRHHTCLLRDTASFFLSPLCVRNTFRNKKNAACCSSV